jgi:hypothetical protein
MNDQDRERREREKAQFPQAQAEDLLNPGRIARDRVAESRTERLGNTTPVGPASSPPADPDDAA